MSEQVRVVVVGGRLSGTYALTNALIRWGADTSEEEPAVQETSYHKRVVVDDEPVELLLVDISGQEAYEATRQLYLRNAVGFICVYAVTSRAEFDEIGALHESILEAKDTAAEPILICGTHCDDDAERQVSTAEGEQLARELSVGFVECSAAASINLEGVFERLVREMRRYGRLARPDPRADRKPCVTH